MRCRFEIYFEILQARPPFEDAERRHQIRQQLNQIPGVLIPEDGITRRPVIKLSVLAQGNRVQQLLGVYDEIIAAIEAEGTVV